MDAGSIFRLARTVRYLRPIQVVGRVARKVRPRRVDDRPAPARRKISPLPAPTRREPVLIEPTRMTAVGIEADISGPGVWQDLSRGALWRYHLHYFDDLRALGAAEREAWNATLLDRWVEENPPLQGVGWDPYPTSLRLVNWIRWALEHGLRDGLVHSLAVQARALRADLEVHLLGNHLFANAKALVFVGTFFEGEEAEALLAKGVSLLERELAEQVLADGGHFERSPMYHAIILEDVLDLIALTRSAPEAFVRHGRLVAQLEDVATRMLRWLRVMTHPDGEIVLFNDAAIGQAPSPAAIDDYARELGIEPGRFQPGGATHLVDTGFVRVDVGDQVAFLDVGPIGPSYLPGHAHADTFTFEVSIAGRRRIVDSGTSHYEPGAERLRQRTTAAHNTVEVDGSDSSEVWGSFRVGRRATVRRLDVREEAGRWVIEAEHDGYTHLPGRVLHRRTWTLDSLRIHIADRIEGRWESAIARVRLDPSIRVEAGAGELRLAADDGWAAILHLGAGESEQVAGTYHPRFDAHEPCVVVEGKLGAGQGAAVIETTLEW